MNEFNTKRLVLASLLAGISGMLEIIPGIPFDVPFPWYNKVSWDLTGIPMVFSLMSTGLTGAIYTVLIGCSFIIFRGNIYGGIFKMIAELSTIIIFAIISRKFIPKIIWSITSRIIIMTGINYIFIPIFYGVPTSFVVGILPSLAILNGSQAIINILPAKIIYSRLSDSRLIRILS